MEKIYLLKGLDCPNCSAKIEKEIEKIDGVKKSVINLMRQTLTVSFEGRTQNEMTVLVEKTVHKYEPEVAVSEYKKSSDTEKEDNKILLRLIAGLVLLAAAVLMPEIKIISITVNVILISVSYLIFGYDVLLKAARNILKGSVFDENFLMGISTIGAFIIGEYTEAAAVMLFYQIGEYFQERAVRNSRKSISDLMDIRPDFAHLYKGGQIKTVSPEKILVGDVIVVKSGERIALDGTVIEGSSSVDMRALSGEAIPKTVRVGDAVLSGSVNGGGLLYIRVEKCFSESTASKIIDMVENASEKKAKSESFITKFAKYYTPAVVLVACMLAIVPPILLSGGWAEWIKRSLVFLVISCPCALVISVPLAFFGGIGAAAKKGILVKGGNYLEAMNFVDTVVFDKTGTLTKGVFKVTDVFPAQTYTKEECLHFAAAAEKLSNHPIAKSISAEYCENIDESKISHYEELSGLGISAAYDGNQIFAGNERLMEEKHIDYHKCDKIGTKVYVAVNGSFVGCIIIADEIKEDSCKAIKELKALGIKQTVMLTGDSRANGQHTAEELGIDNCFTELLPDKKVEILEKLKNELPEGKRIIFVGDGINDAPVLASADIGIAMGGIGSDAAIEAADIVFMTDEPSKIATALNISKFTRRIVTQNIIFALSVKAVFLILGAFGIAGMWLAVFADVGVALIAVLNSMRTLRK